MASVALPIAASALGGYLASRGKTNTQQTTTTPTLDPKFGPLQDLLIRDLHSRLTGPSALPPGYAAAGTSAINRSYGDAAAGIAARNQAAGINGPGAQAPLANLDASRAGQIGTFNAVTVPGQERSMHLEDMAQALNLIGTGRGSSSTGTATAGQSSGASGALDSVGAILGYLAAQGKLGGNGAGTQDPTKPPIRPNDPTLLNLFG